MSKNVFFIFFSIIAIFGVAHGQGLQNPLQNLPEGTVLTIRDKVNVPANSSVVELVQPTSYDVDHFKSLSLVLHISSKERVIEKNTSFTIKRIEYLNRRDQQEGTYKVKMYYGDKREFFLCYFYPEQSPKIASLEQHFKIDVPRASSYDSNW
jgi:hypothetical protein